MGMMAGILLAIIPYLVSGQTPSPAKPLINDTSKVDSLNALGRSTFTTDPERSIAYSDSAKALAEKINYRKGLGIALKNKGIVYYYQAKHVDALDYYNQSLEIFRNHHDNSGTANLLSNIGVVYLERGDYAKALEYYLESLKYAELAGDKYRILIALNNVGGIYMAKPVSAGNKEAEEYFLKAFNLCEELGKKEDLGPISVNLADIYLKSNNDSLVEKYLDNALKAYGGLEGKYDAYNKYAEYYNKKKNYDAALKNANDALALTSKSSNKLPHIHALIQLAETYANKNEYALSLSFFDKAKSVAVEAGTKDELKDVFQKVSSVYAHKKDFANAYKYHSLFTALKDTLYSEDIEKKIGTLQFDFDLQKKQTEINLLTKDKAITDQQLQRQKLVKQALITGLVLMLMIAGLIYRSYRIKLRTNKVLDQQKAQIEQLLLNILPDEVAKELQANGFAVPRHYDSVAVMFTDIEGFTTIAEKMEPRELVKELNTCFMAFDEIIEKYNLEKIKTIGDAYMCAGGIPTPDPKYIENILEASMDIRDYMHHYNDKKRALGQAPWELRLGVHVGPMVAGVVGKKKYAYDIWGLTVNIASRMESNGEPGQVNVSSNVFELMKDKYAFKYRGKIYAKNIGDIDMYFVERKAV